MFDFVKELARWGMIIAPVYIPTMLFFMAFNYYLTIRASKAHSPNLKKKMKLFKEKNESKKGAKK